MGYFDEIANSNLQSLSSFEIRLGQLLTATSLVEEDGRKEDEEDRWEEENDDREPMLMLCKGMATFLVLEMSSRVSLARVSSATDSFQTMLEMRILPAGRASAALSGKAALMVSFVRSAASSSHAINFGMDLLSWRVSVKNSCLSAWR